MTKPKAISCADVFSKLDTGRLHDLGADTYTILPQEMTIRRKRVTYRVTLEQDDDGVTVCRVVYDGCRYRILVPHTALQWALESIWSK